MSNSISANDKVIVVSCVEDEDYMCRKVMKKYTQWGLETNMNKTEYVYVESEIDQDPSLQMRHIRTSEELKYVGSIIVLNDTTSNIGIGELVRVKSKAEFLIRCFGHSRSREQLYCRY